MPHLICEFLYDTAEKFNEFYRECKVVGDPQVQRERESERARERESERASERERERERESERASKCV